MMAALVIFCLVASAALFAVYAAIRLAPYCRAVRSCGWWFAAFAAVATIYGGGKARVFYPQTDPDVAWLIDRGSYVTNDFVHVDFVRVVVPDAAPLYIDRRPVDSTNDTEWAEWITTTFAAFPVPQDIPLAAATNYDFAVYTTWTPGPAVETNGVWHANWGLDRKARRYLIPLRTSVRIDAEVIATPKSKEDHKK